MKKLLLISTGGTISCGDDSQGLSPKLTFDELLSRVPVKKEDVIIDGLQLMNIDSGNFIPQHCLDITLQIEKKYHEYDGFLVTHGTDTLAYTSAALSYLIQNSKKPIVVTGSQRPIEAKGTDAINNLSKSIAFACTCANENIGGVFVVFNNRAIIGTQARKIKTKGDDAFISLNRHDAARFLDGKIEFDSSFLDSFEKNAKTIKFYHNLNTNVHVIKMFPGLNTKAFKYMLTIYDAVVIEAYGTGSIPFEFGDAIDEFNNQNDDDCIILVVSQVMYEGTNMNLYEISKRILRHKNVIEGRLMSTESAVTKLMWALAHCSTEENVINSVKECLAYDF